MTMPMQEHEQEIDAGGNSELIAVIREDINASGGAVTFARFMELALYHPEHGYYLAPGRRPGRGGDFLTAPEASAYFGLTLARQIAECWERLGRPVCWSIREYGSGVGGLAYDIIAGLSTDAPESLPGLRYRLVETNGGLTAQALAAMAAAGLSHLVEAEDAADGDLEPIVGVVLANEVADAQPVHRLVVRDGALRERLVGWRDGGFADVEGLLSPPVADVAAHFAAAGVVLAEGDAVDVSPAAAAWFAQACRGIERGYAVVIDYGYPASTLYQAHRLSGTVRGYASHTVTDDPYRRVGDQDLTSHVDFTALQRAGEAEGMRAAGFTTQGALLASLGLGDLLVDLQRDPDASLADYVSAQTVVMRLIDPGGLGRFGVLIMAKDAPVDPPLAGYATKPPPF